MRGTGHLPTWATFFISSFNSASEPTQVVRKDGSKADPGRSLPLRDDVEEFKELTLAQRGIARAPKINDLH